MEHTRKTECLVNRLRRSSRDGVSDWNAALITDKLDAIGEALAYLLEKKHAKVKSKKVQKQIASISDHEALRLYRKNKKS